MQIRWNKGLSDQEKVDLKSSLVAANSAFKRLSILIEEDIASTIKSQELKGNYACPSWAMLQADYIGETRAYRKILRLINLEDK